MDGHSWRASPQTSATITMARRMELAAILITGNNDYRAFRRAAGPSAHLAGLRRGGPPDGMKAQIVLGDPYRLKTTSGAGVEAVAVAEKAFG
jgi:hypothetical protein